MLQIRDFQLVSQWAEGLKGILRPQLVQESCMFLLPRSAKNGVIYFISCLYKVFSWEIIVINRIDIMNIIFKMWIIRRSYQNIHLHTNYVQSFQEICIYFDQPRHPNGQQWPMTSIISILLRLNNCSVFPKISQIFLEHLFNISPLADCN